MSLSVVIGDNYPVFRTGIARLLAVEDDFRIVSQCEDLARLYHAAESSNGIVVLFASSLGANLERLAERAATSNVRFVAMLDRLESPQLYLRHNIDGILYRDVDRAEVLKGLRTVGRGEKYVQQASAPATDDRDSDTIGLRALDRLSRKELEIVGLVIRGYKNREIAKELQNTEQVIKNYMRSIFDKTGMSDRLELALFTVHNRILLAAVCGSPTVDPRLTPPLRHVA